MVEDQRDLFLRGEAVECAGLEVVEGVVGGGEDGHAVEGVVELALDLGSDLSRLHEAEEGGVLPSLFEDAGEVERGWGRARGNCGRGSLGMGCDGEDEECG